MATEEISADFPFEKRHVKVLDAQMAYVEVGNPDTVPAVFLHGNPASAYLWRNIIPHVAKKTRCIAPDLIGMGDSQKIPGLAYRIVDHTRYLDAFLDAVIPDGKIILVIHDWGSALGFDWARRHENRIEGLAFMEIVTPAPNWDFFTKQFQRMFGAFRSPETGRKLLIDQNAFVENVLPGAVVRKMTEAEMDHYRAPFLDPPTREPLYRFPNEIPIQGSPADVWAMAEKYHAWLLASDLPKLFFWATPGALIQTPKAEWYAKNLKNTRSVDIGPGVHFLQEDNPHMIGREIASWVPTLSGSSDGGSRL